MMQVSPPGQGADQPAPLPRSLTVQVDLAPGRVWWGATWACLCGAAAAGSWPLDSSALARLGTAWLVSVALAGAVWVPLLRPARRRPRVDWPGLRRLRTAPARDVARRVRAWWHDLPPERLDQAFALIAALTLAKLLGAGATAALVVALAVVLAARLAAPGADAGSGWRRSGLEIALPGVVAWCALGGPVPVPVDVTAAGSTIDVVARWLADNGTFAALVLTFTVLHYAATATATTARGTTRGARFRVGLLRGSYVASAAVLAAAGRPFAAGFVLLAFVVQWPFQRHLGVAGPRWHLEGTQWVAMLAMLVAWAVGG